MITGLIILAMAAAVGVYLYMRQTEIDKKRVAAEVDAAAKAAEAFLAAVADEVEDTAAEVIEAVKPKRVRKKPAE